MVQKLKPSISLSCIFCILIIFCQLMIQTYSLKILTKLQQKQLLLSHFLTFTSIIIPIANFMSDTMTKKTTSILPLCFFPCIYSTFCINVILHFFVSSVYLKFHRHVFCIYYFNVRG
jgi:hypothetical protein